MNGIAEGVRQVRGTSVNQVDGVEHVLVTAGTGVPTSRRSSSAPTTRHGAPGISERRRDSGPNFVYKVLLDKLDISRG